MCTRKALTTNATKDRFPFAHYCPLRYIPPFLSSYFLLPRSPPYALSCVKLNLNLTQASFPLCIHLKYACSSSCVTLQSLPEFPVPSWMNTGYRVVSSFLHFLKEIPISFGISLVGKLQLLLRLWNWYVKAIRVQVRRKCAAEWAVWSNKRRFYTYTFLFALPSYY